MPRLFSFLLVFDVLLEWGGFCCAGPGLDDADGQSGSRQQATDGPAVLLRFDGGGDAGPVRHFQRLR